MNNYSVSFAIAGSIMTIIFLTTVNLLTSPDHLWFIYPTFALLLWPIGVYCRKQGKIKLLSLFYSAVIIVFLTLENYLKTPDYPWALYAIYPILLWPILIFIGENVKKLSVALIGSLSVVIYYLFLNILISPGHPWVIYPAFLVLWWPLSLYHAKNKSYVAFSVHASILSSVFFISVNAVTSPYTVWAVYPIFSVLWWPLSMYYFVYKKRVGH